MSDDNSVSLVNLGELSKPADTLIKKVSSAIGGVFEPWQIKRVAKAQAEANLIKAKNEIEITDLHRRAINRFVEEEANRQENMEEITKKSIPHLKEESKPEQMENDWITNFFDKSRIISDEEMQALWAKVLAGEANSPGTYSKRTVNLLSDLDKKDADLFRSLCRFGWVIGDFKPLIFDPHAEIYNSVGIGFDSLSHLDSLGLIRFNGIYGFSMQHLPKQFIVIYCGKPLFIKMPQETENVINIGNVLLTQAGKELASICDAPPVEGFFDYVKERWQQYLP
jgi:hypothetical protein